LFAAHNGTQFDECPFNEKYSSYSQTAGKKGTWKPGRSNSPNASTILCFFKYLQGRLRIGRRHFVDPDERSRFERKNRAPDLEGRRTRRPSATSPELDRTTLKGPNSAEFRAQVCIILNQDCEDLRH
jgi:hypothetical protein